ncbi:hypothetical protein D3C72_2533000 [compost metagenome]
MEPDKYYWVLQNDRIARTEMTLNRYSGAYQMEIAYVEMPNDKIKGVGWSISGTCQPSQLPEPKL